MLLHVCVDWECKWNLGGEGRREFASTKDDQWLFFSRHGLIIEYFETNSVNWRQCPKSLSTYAVLRKSILFVDEIYSSLNLVDAGISL